MKQLTTFEKHWVQDNKPTTKYTVVVDPMDKKQNVFKAEFDTFQGMLAYCALLETQPFHFWVIDQSK